MQPVGRMSDQFRYRRVRLAVAAIERGAKILGIGGRYKPFDAYDLEWLDYVVDCRKGGTCQLQYDIVEGGVANDNVIDTVELYENGDITPEQALGQLAYKEVNHQIAVLNQKIVDRCLRFVGCEEVVDVQ